jgi:hypothetical protein
MLIETGCHFADPKYTIAQNNTGGFTSNEIVELQRLDPSQRPCLSHYSASEVLQLNDVAPAAAR